MNLATTKFTNLAILLVILMSSLFVSALKQPINVIICLSGYGEVGTLQSLACLAIENLVRKSLDQVGLGRGGEDGGDDHNGVTDIGDDGDGDDFNNGVMVMVMMMIAKVVSVMVMIAPKMMVTWS